jgi:hypothetical protein
VSDSNREWGENTDRAIQLRHVRTYAARLRKISDMYSELERMAQLPDSHLAPVLAVAGRIALSGLSEAGELLGAMYPTQGTE